MMRAQTTAVLCAALTLAVERCRQAAGIAEDLAGCIARDTEDSFAKRLRVFTEPEWSMRSGKQPGIYCPRTNS